MIFFSIWIEYFHVLIDINNFQIWWYFIDLFDVNWFCTKPQLGIRGLKKVQNVTGMLLNRNEWKQILILF